MGDDVSAVPFCPPVDRITEELCNMGISWVDKRSDGGALWVVGDSSILSSIYVLRDLFGASFTYCKLGSESTGHQPSWYTTFRSEERWIPAKYRAPSFEVSAHPGNAAKAPEEQDLEGEMRPSLVDVLSWEYDSPKQADAGIHAVRSHSAKEAGGRDRNSKGSSQNNSQLYPTSGNIAGAGCEEPVRADCDSCESYIASNRTPRKPDPSITVAPIANESLTAFYRARFQIRPESNEGAEIWPQIIRTLHNWIEDKEEMRDQIGVANLYRTITADIVKYSLRFRETNRDCYFSKSFAQGLFDEAQGWSRLRTAKETGVGTDDVPQYWAMEYIEQDQSLWYRRWCTNVGITAQLEDSGNMTGSYTVNVRVSIVDDAMYVSNRPKIPPRSVPRFVQDMLRIENCAAYSNSIRLTSRPLPITAGNFAEFAEDLVSDTRIVPIVTISNKVKNGEVVPSPVDADKLARQLGGSAVVRTIDCSNGDLKRAYWDYFASSEGAREYRAWGGTMRIYFPGIDIENGCDASKHRFYLFENLTSCDLSKVKNDICGSIMRLLKYRAGEALDPKSIQALADLAKREEYASKYHSLLAERKANKSKESAIDEKSIRKIEDLRAAYGQVKAENEELKNNESFYLEYIENLESSQSGDHAGTNGRAIEALQDQISARDVEITGLNDQIGRMRYAARNLEALVDALQSERDAATARASAILQMESFPSTCLQALEFAERMFPQNLIVLEEAKRSASNCRGDCNEVYRLLRSMACSLWSILFSGEAPGNIESQFREETNIELSLRETGQTNNDSNLVRLRKRTYCGQEVDITPHVKGSSSSRGDALRIHFYIDRENKKIVIGHCGGHLRTSGTRRIH